MHKTPKSISSSCNNDDGVPEETGIEKVLSDLQALKKLYGLLQRLDETSRALLKKLLDDATRQALQKQAKALSTAASDSVIPSPLGSASKMDQETPSSSFLNNKEAEMEQILSDLQALTRLYMLLHKDPSSDENLDEASRALLMKILEDATQEAVRRQAKMLSGSLVSPALERKLSTRSNCRTRHADPRLRPVASPRPSLLANERLRQLNLQRSTVSSRSGLHADGHRHAAEEPPLARLVSNRSSRTALPAQHRPRKEQRHSSLSLHRFPAARTSRHGTVTGGTRLADRRDSICRSSGRGDQWSLERSSRRSLSRELSLGPSSRLHCRATPRRQVEAESSSSVHHFERLDSGLSQSMTSRHAVAHSTVSSRSVLRADGHRHAAEEPPLARLDSKRSSRTALPARHRPSQEQWHSSLSLHRFPIAGTSQHGMVTRGARLANHRDNNRRNSGRGDRWSLERSSSGGSSSRRSVSRRELSQGPSSRLHGRATPRHVETESSYSTRSFERLDSGLSASITSRHGVERAGRGVATPERSSSSNTVATIQSRIRPSNTLLKERSIRRSAAEEGWTSRRRQQGSDASSAAMYSSMSSDSRSSSGAASLSASTSPTAPPAPRAFANPYYYSPPVTAPRSIVPPVYAPEVSRSMRRRRRQEILEKRVARLRMLKDKIATVFNHRHDHHHHHHLGGSQEAGPSSRSVVRSAGHLNSPWQYLTSMFHFAKGKVKNTRRRTVVGVPEKRSGGGGDMRALFDAVRRHLKKGKRRAPAGIKLRRKGSRVRANKMHWWQQLRRRDGMAGVIAGSKPRRRLGHGKAGWL